MTNTSISINKGSSVKLASVMLLLMLFSITCLTLALAAARSFKDVDLDKRRISELMVALSYLNMKIRQNDCVNSMHIRPSPSGEGQALVITETLDSAAYETWIYFEDDGLREAFVLEGDEVTQNTSFLIAEIGGFDVRIEQPGGKSPKIRIDIWRDSGKTPRELSLTLALRAAYGM
ncbi:MAG: DUF4860 domain-containing protein [Bacillota bacterium]